MTPEEAIKTIQVAIAEVEWNYPMDYSVAFETAMEALEKQIPKKPINNGIGGYICPHCQGVILDLRHELYHRDCGGRLE